MSFNKPGRLVVDRCYDFGKAKFRGFAMRMNKINCHRIGNRGLNLERKARQVPELRLPLLVDLTIFHFALSASIFDTGSSPGRRQVVLVPPRHHVTVAFENLAETAM